MNNEEKVINILKKRYVSDLAKPDLDIFERAAILRSLMEEEDWTMQEVGEQCGKNKHTIRDWLLFDQISEKEYANLRKNGVRHVDIFHALRTKSGGGVASLQSRSDTKGELGDIESWAKEIITTARNYRKNRASISQKINVKTENLLNDAANEINNLIVELRLIEKSKNKKENGVK
jgi:hypothetical protein